MRKLKVTLGINAAELSRAVEKTERQGAYADRRKANLTKIREDRLKGLAARKASIESATTLYRSLDSGDQPIVRIRSTFIRLPRPGRPPRDTSRPYAENRDLDVDTRPPLTKLIHRPSNALQVMMTAIYLAHLEHKPGEVVTNPRRNNFSEGWVDLSGLMDRAANSKENNLRVTRALRKLANARLVTVGPPGQRDRFEGFKLKRENGKGDKDYKVPGESLMLRQAALLPAEFFYYGWHLVLTPEELATFLVIVMETQFRAHHPRSVLIGDQGIGLSRKVRWRDYGLASEAYNSIHELKEFGLIDLVDPMVGRKGGKVKDPKALDMRAYRLIWPPSPDATAVPGPAFDVVTNCLTENPSPPRTDT